MNVLPVAALLILAAFERISYVAFFERVLKVTFKDAPVRSFLFFGAWCAIFVAFFPHEVTRLFVDVSVLGYLALLFIVLVVFPVVFRLLRRDVGVPTWLSHLYPSQSMLSLEERYILAKIGDVVSQQLAGGIFLLLVSDLGVSYPTLVMLFVALFALSHIYLFATSGLIWGLHYTAFSVAAGFAVPFFIFHIPGGVMYAIVLHLAFYVFSAAFFAEFPRPSRAVCIDVLHDHESAARAIHS